MSDLSVPDQSEAGVTIPGYANNIALVDDDRNILTSVTMTLEAEGYNVDCYTDGADVGQPDTIQQNVGDNVPEEDAPVPPLTNLHRFQTEIDGDFISRDE